MELSVNLKYIGKQRGTKEQRDFMQTAELCREAGFRYVDYSPECTISDWAEQARRDREILDRTGIVVEQSHAPFNRYGRYPDELFGTYYRNLFEASKIVGAKYVVVHADEYRTVDHYDEQEIQEWTYEFLAPYVDYAKKNDMVVAIENVFEDQSALCPQFDGKSRFTSRLHELQGIIERFNDPAVQCCWDFGHASCEYGTENMLDAMKQMGKYLRCTHVHDNYYRMDLHLVPFLGSIDWEANMAALKKIGYSGKLSFEMTSFGCMPEALTKEWLRMLNGVGRQLVELYEKA